MTEYDSESLPFEPPEQENTRLRAENARLRRLLAAHGIPIPQLAPDNQPPTTTVEPARLVDKEELARKRIALFRSLFRGREDVYARRWENDDGRHGYMPVVIKDWKAINRSRPEERKKVDQKARKFIPPRPLRRGGRASASRALVAPALVRSMSPVARDRA